MVLVVDRWGKRKSRKGKRVVGGANLSRVGLGGTGGCVSRAVSRSVSKACDAVRQLVSSFSPPQHGAYPWPPSLLMEEGHVSACRRRSSVRRSCSPPLPLLLRRMQRRLPGSLGTGMYPPPDPARHDMSLDVWAPLVCVPYHQEVGSAATCRHRQSRESRCERIRRRHRQGSETSSKGH